MSSPSIPLTLTCNGQKRRVNKSDVPESFSALAALVQDRFALSNAAAFRVTYEDDGGDDMTICSTGELMDALLS